MPSAPPDRVRANEMLYAHAHAHAHAALHGPVGAYDNVRAVRACVRACVLQDGEAPAESHTQEPQVLPARRAGIKAAAWVPAWVPACTHTRMPACVLLLPRSCRRRRQPPQAGRGGRERARFERRL